MMMVKQLFLCIAGAGIAVICNWVVVVITVIVSVVNVRYWQQRFCRSYFTCFFNFHYCVKDQW